MARSTGRKGYLLPETLQPATYRSVCVSIPDDPGHVRAFLGQVYRLTYWNTWQRNPTKEGRLAANAWQTPYELLDAALSDNVPCGGEDYAPYWDDEDGSDTDDTAIPSVWYEDVSDFIVTAFLAASFTPGAAIKFVTTARQIRWAFRRRDYGAIVKIFLGGELFETVDTYSAVADVVYVDADLTEDTEIRIEHSGTANANAVPIQGFGYGMEVIRKNLRRDVVVALQDVRTNVDGVTLEKTWDNENWFTFAVMPDIAPLVADITTLQGQVTQLSGEVATNSAAIVTLQGQVTQLSGEVATNTADITTLQGQVTQLSGEVVTIAADLLTLQGQVTQLSGEVATNTADITTLQGQVTQLSGEIADIQSDITTLQGNVNQLAGELAFLEAKIAEVAGQERDQKWCNVASFIAHNVTVQAATAIIDVLDNTVVIPDAVEGFFIGLQAAFGIVIPQRNEVFTLVADWLGATTEDAPSTLQFTNAIADTGFQDDMMCRLFEILLNEDDLSDIAIGQMALVITNMVDDYPAYPDVTIAIAAHIQTLGRIGVASIAAMSPYLDDDCADCIAFDYTIQVFPDEQNYTLPEIPSADTSYIIECSNTCTIDPGNDECMDAAHYFLCSNPNFSLSGNSEFTLNGVRVFPSGTQYNNQHTYSKQVVADGQNWVFRIEDFGNPADNTGWITVRVYEG